MAAELPIRRNVALGPLTTLGVGGLAQWFVDVTTVDEIAQACRWASERGLPLTVLGGGSNVVIHDAGVAGLVARVRIVGRTLRWAGDVLEVQSGAGEAWDALVEACVGEGAWGLEGLSGIPGTVGATPVQNVGAYGQDVSQTITSVLVVDREQGEPARLGTAACAFGYRDSRFRSKDRDRYIIAGVTFQLHRGRPRSLYPEVERILGGASGEISPAAVRQAVLTLRRAKGMVVESGVADSRSVGSFFVNPVIAAQQADALAAQAPGIELPRYPAGAGFVKVPAAWLIERAGWFRGGARGPVGLSTRHTLALVNRGGATADDVVELAVAIKRAVQEQCGVALCAEPVFLGFMADARVAFLKGTES